MTEHRDHSARPEQPGNGGFEAGVQTLPDDDRVGQFSDGNETLPDDDRVAKFSDGAATLPTGEHEGRFSDSVDSDGDLTGIVVARVEPGGDERHTELRR